MTIKAKRKAKAKAEGGGSKGKSKELYSSSSGELFRKLAGKTAHAVGHPGSFTTALLVVLVWGITGPLFHFSDTWQLVINTGTTIITFLMVFLIQNTQNRDSHALHLKLDELIHANKHARNRMIALEELSESELDDLQHEFDRLACEKVEAARESRNGGEDQDADDDDDDDDDDSTSSSLTSSRSSRTESRSSTSER